MSGIKRNTATRDRDRARIARDKPACHICGASIDYTLPHLDPMSFVVDHVIPLAKGGIDALANKKAAHRRPRVQQQEAGQTSRTHRQAVWDPLMTHPGDPPRTPPMPLWV